MNRERIQQLRDHLAKVSAQKFRMDDWFHDGESSTYQLRDEGRRNGSAAEGSCGTAACIAGHALALFDPESVIPNNPRQAAGSILGLTDLQALYLFVPQQYDKNAPMDAGRALPPKRRMARITRTSAVKVLDHLLETGKVDWRVIA